VSPRFYRSVKRTNEVTMPGVFIFGFVGIAAGILVWLVSAPLSRFATNSHLYLRPDSDKASYQRRNITRIRIIGSIMGLVGVVAVVVGLLGGR
jgi:hypothetical protein